MLNAADEPQYKQGGFESGLHRLTGWNGSGKKADNQRKGEPREKKSPSSPTGMLSQM